MLRNGMFIADRYEIIDHIGSGGMSDVYKAKDHKLNRFVAVKILKPEFSEDQSFVSKFRVEAQSAAGLTHPNIVNVFDVGDEDGIHYIVMELVEGIVLKKYIEKKGHLSVKEATSILIQVAQGIECAHNHHIIHRDIKPQNIIISKEGKVKVADFGIARAASTSTINSSAMGSVHYISPEQARGGYSDEKSDIYSLGITFYEMVTGKLPFDGDNTVNVALQHIQEKMVSPREFIEELPVSTEKIILKCTLKKPERRYLKVADLISDLKKSLVTPDSDFVKIIDNTDTDATQTVVLTPEQMKEISEKAGMNNSGYGDEDDDEYDEESDEEVNPKFDKAMTGMLIGVAVIILCIAIFVIVKMVSIFNTSSSKGEETTAETTISELVEVPGLIGLTEEEAIERLKENNLGVKTKKATSDEYGDGLVFEQSEKEGTMVERNTTIVITISSGEETFELDDVSGMDVDAAIAQLKDAGLNYTVENEYSDDVEENKVVKTRPEKGSSVSEGDVVTIVVSSGKENKTVAMISILGKDEGTARMEVEALGLKISDKITKDYSSQYPAGQVMSQNIPEGEMVTLGTEIEISISLGEELTYKYLAEPITVTAQKFTTEIADKENVSAQVKVILEQTDSSGRLIQTTLQSYTNATASSFPMTFNNVEGVDGIEKGTVKVYITYTYTEEKETETTTTEDGETVTAETETEVITQSEKLLESFDVKFEKAAQ